MFKVKIKPYTFVLYIIFILQTDFFCIAGDLTNYALLLTFAFSAYALLSNLKRTKRKAYPQYTSSYILLMVIFTVAAFLGAKNFGSSISTNFAYARWVYVYTFFYFALNTLMNRNLVTASQLKSALRNIAIMQLAIYILQFIVQNQIIFTDVLMGYRFGNRRFYFDIALIVILFYLCVNDILAGIETKKNVMLVILIIFEIVMINQYRMSALSVVFAGISVFILARGKTRKKLLFFPAVIIGLIVFSNTNLFQEAIAGIFVQDTVGTISGRANFIDWTLQNIIVDKNFFGLGIIANESGMAYANHGIFNHYFIGDHGIWGFIFEVGLGMVLFWLGIVIKLIFISNKRIGSNERYFYIGYAIFIFVNSYSENYWILGSGLFYLSVVLNMHEYEQITCD